METIRPATIAEQADRAARLAVETFTHEPNPHEEGSHDAKEYDRCYRIALERLSAAVEGEASA